MKKKLYAICILVILVFALTACKKEKQQQEENPSGSPETETTTIPEQEEETVPEATEEPELTPEPEITPQITEKPEESSQPEETPKTEAEKQPEKTKKPSATKKPAVPTKKPVKPTQKPIKPTKKPEVSKVSVSDLQNAVKKAYGDNYIPSMNYSETELEEIFGVKKDWYDSMSAQGPMISIHVDKFIAIEAKKGNVEDVKKALESYKQALIEETLQYPMNLSKIQASRIEVIDNYVFYIMLGQISEEIQEQEEEVILKEAQKQNEIAVKAIKKEMGK